MPGLRSAESMSGFGHPSRITARIRLGGGKMVDIEVEMGGPIHSKGVLILSGFPDRPAYLSLPAWSSNINMAVSRATAPRGPSCAPSCQLQPMPRAANRRRSPGSINQHGQVQAVWPRGSMPNSPGFSLKISTFCDWPSCSPPSPKRTC